jgi:hypothetical protein
MGERCGINSASCSPPFRLMCSVRHFQLYRPIGCAIFHFPLSLERNQSRSILAPNGLLHSVEWLKERAFGPNGWQFPFSAREGTRRRGSFIPFSPEIEGQTSKGWPASSDRGLCCRCLWRLWVLPANLPLLISLSHCTRLVLTGQGCIIEYQRRLYPLLPLSVFLLMNSISESIDHRRPDPISLYSSSLADSSVRLLVPDSPLSFTKYPDCSSYLLSATGFHSFPLCLFCIPFFLSSFIRFFPLFTIFYFITSTYRSAAKVFIHYVAVRLCLNPSKRFRRSAACRTHTHEK